MARPIYGGWVSFTAHLSLKNNLPLYKIGNKTEKKKDNSPVLREYGYGAQYQNISPNDIKNIKTEMLITAIDKNYYEHLNMFPSGTYIVIHDPTEVNKKTASEYLMKHLKRFKIITIRESVKKYLKKEYDLDSTFLIHPFYEYSFSKSPRPSDAVSISRIDFDKHTDIILDANKKLSEKQKIDIYGAINRQYVFFKLKDTDFTKYYKGSFDKSFESLNDILKDAKFCIDMSVIKYDGGGTQYTFLEAIYQQCALVINKKWVDGFKTPFVNKKNCFVVENGNELSELIKESPNINSITKNAFDILKPHLKIDWVKEMNKIK